MPVKLVVETVEKEIKMMTDPTAEYVSLVKHGASRMPFRVIKAQKGGTVHAMPMVVQSILLPKTLKLEEVSTLKGNEWMAEVRAEKSHDFDDYTKLTQAEASKFEASSMKMLRLPGGALALVGQLAEGVDPNGMLTISEQVEKDNPLDTPLDAVAATVTEEPQPYSYDVTFRDLLWREMDALNSVIVGTLQQAASDPKKRKAAILNAVDSFRNFMSMGLDQISTAAIKMEKDGENQEGEQEMFKTKEEFVEAVGAVVDEKLAAKADKKLTPEEQAALDAKSKKDEVVAPAAGGEINIAAMIGAAIDKAVAPLVAKIEAVAVKQDELGATLVTDTASKEEDPETDTAKKEEKDAPKSVFGGLLTGKALTKRGLQNVLHGGE
jgi:hypothetical protein